MIEYLLCLSLAICCACAAVAVSASVARREGLRLRFSSPGSVAALSIGTILAPLAISKGADVTVRIVTEIGVTAVIVCAITDAQTGYIFDLVTAPAAAITATISALNGDVVSTLLGGAVATGALALIFAATLGRGIGLGDVKLGAVIGCALGTTNALIALEIAFACGGAYAAYLLLSARGRRGDAVAFAPFLAVGTGLVLLFRSFA